MSAGTADPPPLLGRDEYVREVHEMTDETREARQALQESMDRRDQGESR